MAEVTIDTTKITDWPSFHAVFKESLGFPDFYGRNMNAWIDCLRDLNDDCGLCGIKLSENEMLHLHIISTEDFNNRRPEIVDELIACTSFVNDYYVKTEGQPKIALIFTN